MHVPTIGGGHRRRTTIVLLTVLAMIAGTAAFAAMPVSETAHHLDNAQSHPKPTVLSKQLQPLEDVQTRHMPALDFKRIEQEDQQREAMGLAPRFAIPHEVAITPQTHGTWEALDRNTQVWRLRIASKNARSINLGFTKYDMPVGGQLFVHAADMTFTIRPFTAADNKEHGQLWTPPVPSNDIVIEITVPTAAQNDLQLELGSINLGYRGFGPGDMQPISGSCNVDVVCEEGEGWEDEIQSVAVISTGGFTFCTGFMVNNVRNDQTPYFMTAAHCGVGSGNAASLVTYWNYENSYCRPPGSAGGPGDGSLDQFNTGATFRASYGPSDVTLVELDDDPDPGWFISFAGWDATGADADWAVGIHHPQTQEKRISFEFSPTTTTSYLGELIPGDGTHVRVEDWDIGTTEPGSSGSPLFNQDHRVIGQLHGGYASCTSNTSDWYGKFSVSFTGGGTPSTSLKPWLDPDDTGTLVVDTLSTQGMSVSPLGDVAHLGDVGGPFTNDEFVYEITNNTLEPVTYEVYLAEHIGLLINGGSSPISDTIEPGTTHTVMVTLGAPIYGLSAGMYEEVITFEDMTTGVVREQTHIIEVGQTGIEVSPDESLFASGPEGGPFEQSMDYTVTSTHPTPVDVMISVDEPWITINGESGPMTLALNGIGDSDTVEIGFASLANTLDTGLHTASVLFENVDPDGAGSTSRDVVLEVGKMVYHADDLPQPIEDHTTTTNIIDVDDDFCVANVEVELDITHTWIGDLTVDLVSPYGTTVRLHNRTGGSDNDIVTLYSESGEGTSPDGPGSLADFNLENAAGEWSLIVHDHAFADQGTLNEWSLRLLPFDDDCPEPEQIYVWNMDGDPAWETEGLWEFGQPQGGGGQYGNPNPTSGYSGPYVYGYNLTGDYENNLAPKHLTTTAIDCSDLTFVQLRFMRYLNVEQPAYDKASISVSADGENWTQIWENLSEITDSDWSQQKIDISSVADGEDTVYIRWTIGPTDGSWQYSGWNIDDVEIWAVPAEPACPEDLTGSGVVDVLDLLQLIGAWGQCNGCPEDLNGDGEVDVLDLLQLIGAWGPCE